MLGSTGYGTMQRSLQFDGDEANYEMWEDKLLAYMKLHKLKNVINPDSNTVATQDQKEESYAQLVQFLDKTSHSLVMRDGKDDGRKALSILREHYRGSGKQRIISLYTTLTTLQKGKDEDLTSYIIKAENAATALKSAGSIVEDALLIAMILKGLPPIYKPFTVFVTQQDKPWTFLSFKTAIRNFEENERASIENATKNSDNIMAAQVSSGGVTCHVCSKEGHKSYDCPNKRNGENPKKHQKNGQGKNGKWCKIHKTNSHDTSECRNNKDNGKDSAKHVGHRQQHENSPGNHSFVLAISDKKKPEKLSSIPKEDNTEELSSSSVEKKQNENKTQHASKIMAASDIRKPDSSNSLLVDSGASSSIGTDISDFIEFDESFKADKHTVELADGTVQCFAEKKGTMLIHLHNDQGNLCSIQLKETLYCATFPADIFSVKSATKKGATFVLCEGDSRMIMKDGTVFPISTKGDLFYFNPVEINKSKIKDFANVVQPISGRHSLEEWHKIFGHVNEKDILKLENLIEDMTISSKKAVQCETCILSKQIVPQNRIPDERAHK
jgi:hypothetical protein